MSSVGELKNYKYGQLLRSLENDHALGNDWYPRDMEEAIQVMTLYSERALKRKEKDKDGASLSFAQWKQNIKCWNCGKKGHHKSECPERKVDQDTEESEEQTQLTQLTNLEASGVNTNAWFDGNYD